MTMSDSLCGSQNPDEIMGGTKTPLKIDWKRLMVSDNGEPAMALEVVPNSPQNESTFESSRKEEMASLSDKELLEKIQRLESMLHKFGSLPDSGAKLNARLKCLLHEQECRNFRKDRKLSEVTPLSESKRLSDVSKDFDTKVSFPARVNTVMWAKERSKSESILPCRNEPFKCPSTLCFDESRNPSVMKSRSEIPSKLSFDMQKNLFSFSSGKKYSNSHTPPQHKLRKTIVLLDEEETNSTKFVEVDTPAKWNSVCGVELHPADLRCLDPGCPLSSPVMNFYIQHLQRVTASDERNYDYHFFNTYFYMKLVEAVSSKDCEQNTLYERTRRWWKGVSIFQKAYLFLPIHADSHWSLAIVCFPDIKDECGPIIVHLDSLGYHSSQEIFHNIERFLKAEWAYVNKSGGPSDIHIPDKMWKILSRKIEKKKPSVPRQRNDYDCGLFVLYFIERFINDAPKRIRKKDLSMFGRGWFLAHEASNLRSNIRELIRRQLESHESGSKDAFDAS